MADVIQIVTTTDTRDLAEVIARALVADRLAACVQIVGPVTSVYHWQGKLETAEEWQLWIKTTRERFEAVEQAIRQRHSYSVPEILALPVVAGGGDYLQWLAEQVAEVPAKPD